jgi:hypothetical protein
MIYSRIGIDTEGEAVYSKITEIYEYFFPMFVLLVLGSFWKMTWSTKLIERQRERVKRECTHVFLRLPG